MDDFLGSPYFRKLPYPSISIYVHWRGTCPDMWPDWLTALLVVQHILSSMNTGNLTELGQFVDDARAPVPGISQPSN